MNKGNDVPIDFTDPIFTSANRELLSPKFSEDALATRFTDRYVSNLRYVAAWRRWMHHDGARWAEDSTLKVWDRIRAICREAAEESLVIEQKPALAKHLTSGHTVSAIEFLARCDSRTAATIDQWDADPMALNTFNGVTCDLHTGITRAHQPEDYATKSTRVTPAKGDCPLWRKFLERITAGDGELQGYLQRAAGYCLTGITSEQVLFFAYGKGANGKSTFSSTLLGICGDYAQTAQMETFTENKHERHSTELAALRGARLVVASETEVGKRWAESRIKALTGGDPVRAHFMRCDDFEFVPQFKLWVQGNHRPGLRSVDEAIRRRLHLIPFTVTIPPHERDPKLSDKLRAEWPQILAWALEGCVLWQREGLNPPAAVRDATDEYLNSEDALASWMDECVIQSPQAGTTKTSLLYQNFKLWAERTGEYCGSQKRFSQDLKDRGFVIRESHGKVIDGIALRDDG
jgi:putative DNA primase/helicase